MRTYDQCARFKWFRARVHHTRICILNDEEEQEVEVGNE